MYKRQPDAWVTVLGNLIENAIEGLNQTRRGTKEVSVSIREGADNLFLCVEDTGPGIPSALRRTLFERGASSKGHSRGTGLALVREVVEAYHCLLYTSLYEARAYGGGLPFAVHLVVQLSRLHGSDRRLVAGVHSHLAVHGGKDQGLGGADVELPLRGDDLQVEGGSLRH